MRNKLTVSVENRNKRVQCCWISRKRISLSTLSNSISADMARVGRLSLRIHYIDKN